MNTKLFALLLLLCVVLAFPVAARKGVGIVWNTETEIVKEGTNYCIEYGIYNPWDEDVNALLSVSEEFKPIVNNEESEPRLVEGGTKHDRAVPINLCFDIDNVYQQDCLFGDFFCQQKCDVQPVTHEGKIVVMEETTGSAGMGSSTTLGVSVPLKLKVQCNAHPRDWTLAYLALAILLSILIIIVLLRRRKNKA